jgi:peptidoglycan hydrolase CwlO-like protein
MNYVITFADVMTGVITVIFGVLAFFIRRWFTEVEDKNAETQKKVEEGNKAIQERIERNDAKVNERIDRLEEKTEKDIRQLKQEVNDIKGDFATTFVLREDFFRSMNGVEDKVKSIDMKLDRLLLTSRKDKE